MSCHGDGARGGDCDAEPKVACRGVGALQYMSAELDDVWEGASSTCTHVKQCRQPCSQPYMGTT